MRAATGEHPPDRLANCHGPPGMRRCRAGYGDVRSRVPTTSGGESARARRSGGPMMSPVSTRSLRRVVVILGGRCHCRDALGVYRARWWTAATGRRPSSTVRRPSGSASAVNGRRRAPARTRRPVGCTSSSPTPTMARTLSVPWFSIHGTVDTLDPVLESAICIGQNPPPGGNDSDLPGSLPDARPRRPRRVPAAVHHRTARCRFEVIVRDNDKNRRSVGRRLLLHHPVERHRRCPPSSIPPTVFYTRAGLLSSGNLTVD